MPRALRLPTPALAGALLVALGCAATPRVRVPPRIDLGDWAAIGIVEFENPGDPGLGSLATSHFVQMIQEAQPGVRILELGPGRRLLAELGRDELDLEAVRALGERFQVDALFTGALELGVVRPKLRLEDASTSVRARADVDGRLATKLFETRSGATVWSRAASATANVARLGVHAGGGLPSFQMHDPKEAYAGLVPELVSGLADDFYPTWRR